MHPSNRLPFLCLAALVIYWSFGLTLPKPYVSSVASIMLFILGGLTAARYFPAAWDIVIHGRRHQDFGLGRYREGSHFAALGIFLIGAGSVWIGAYAALWQYLGQPISWSGTAAAGFGRFLVASGFWLLWISPDIADPKSEAPQTAMFVVILFIAVSVAFLLGMRAEEIRQGFDRDTWRSSYAACPHDRPIWGTMGTKVYHPVDSPWRDNMLPRRCFKDEDEARTAGFRPVVTTGAQPQ